LEGARQALSPGPWVHSARERKVQTSELVDIGRVEHDGRVEQEQLTESGIQRARDQTVTKPWRRVGRSCAPDLISAAIEFLQRLLESWVEDCPRGDQGDTRKQRQRHEKHLGSVEVHAQQSRHQ